MIYVTIGTMHLPFARLIRKMDEIARATDERIVVQTGLDNVLPEHCEHFDFKAREEVEAIQREARVIVAHAGIGSVIDALKTRVPLIFVPRLAKFGEHNNDHQLEMAKVMDERGWGRIVVDIEDLDDACAHPPDPYAAYRPDRDRLLEAVRETILKSVAKRFQSPSGTQNA